MVIKDKDDILHAKYLAIYGLLLGFPYCCISEFITTFKNSGEKRYSWELRKPGEKRKLYGTGFVPCSRCNARYTSEQLIEIIDSNRKYPIPFRSFVLKVNTEIDDEILENLASKDTIREMKKVLRKVKFKIELL